MGMEQRAKCVQLTSSAMKWALTLAKAALQTVQHRKVPRNWRTANVNLEIFTMVLAHVTSTRLCEMATAFSAANCTCNAPSKASQLQPQSPRFATLGWNPKPRRLASVSLQTRRNVVLAVMTAVRATTELFAQAALTDFGPSRADASSLDLK